MDSEPRNERLFIHQLKGFPNCFPAVLICFYQCGNMKMYAATTYVGKYKAEALQKLNF